MRLVQKQDSARIDLITTLANMISIRNYLSMMYAVPKMEATAYKRINKKVQMLDTQILNLALLVEVPFEVVEDEPQQQQR